MSKGKPQADSSGKNLRLRIASALVLGTVALAVTFLGGFAFRLFAAGAAAIVFHEWTAMHRPPVRAHAIFSRLALAVVLAPMLAGIEPPLSLAVAGAAILAVLLSGLLTAHLRGSDLPGLLAILFLYAVVWVTDIFAYFVGRALGGPKLAPSISPGKTWSGAVGGLLGGAAAGTALALAAGVRLPLTAVLVLALLLSAVSQAGDLFESAVKRRQGVKDSGTLIPGHGGVMDRIDGLVAAALGFYLFGMMYSGFVMPAGFFSR
jgi:phosphatidate cytidylyltransferase